MPEQRTRICCKDQKWNWKITICSLNHFSFLSLLTTDPNSIQMTRSPPSELNILRRRDGRWRADRTWQRDQGIFRPSCESSYESRVYYNSCMRAGWRDHSDSRRHDRAKSTIPTSESRQTAASGKSSKSSKDPMKTKRGMMDVMIMLDLPETGLPTSLHKFWRSLLISISALAQRNPQQEPQSDRTFSIAAFSLSVQYMKHSKLNQAHGFWGCSKGISSEE